ncbi:GIY-YIG nuclease family protein [Salinibacterium soli]
MRCAIEGCGGMPERGAPLELCASHLMVAYDWVARDVGVTDLLPSPCLACGSRLGVRYPSGWLCAICEWRLGELPDDAASARVDVVYYVRAGDRIKIGTSGNPRGRLAALHWDQLLAFERGGRTLEQRRHAQFAAHRYPGSEWFASNEPLLAHIAALSAGVDDPWNEYARWVSEALALR